MLAAGVGPLWVDRSDLRLDDLAGDVRERDVAVMGAGVIAPADVEPDPLGRNPLQGGVDGLDGHRQVLIPAGDAAADRPRVRGHREIR
jgi:hypothetical protein